MEAVQLQSQADLQMVEVQMAASIRHRIRSAIRHRIRSEDRPMEEILYGTLRELQVLQQQGGPGIPGGPGLPDGYIEMWIKNRMKTIKLIATLREKVEIICSRCNTGRQVGLAASVGGLLSAVVGAILKVTGIPAGDQFLDGSKYFTVGGTLILESSNLAEACLTLEPTNRIKEVIQRDIELTKPIRRWIELSRDVERCFDQLLDCSIASPGFLKVVKVLENCISLVNEGTYEIGELIQDLRRGEVKGIGNITLDIIRKVVRCLERIRNNPNIRKSLNEICKIVCETPSLIQFVKIGISVYLGTYGILPCLPFGFRSSNIYCLALDVGKMLLDLVTNFRLKEIETRQTAYFEALEKVSEALKSELKQVVDHLNL